MEDRKQLFIDCKLNFNLHKLNTHTPTLIYAVVYFRRKQYKISTGVKVYPKQWNKKKQIAVVSSRLTQLENYNNSIVNEKIKKIQLSFEKSKLYFCEHPESLSDFYTLLKQRINPSMASKKKITKDNIPATIQMKQLLSKVDKDTTRKIYHGNINIFKQFLENEKIPDTWNSITCDMLERYKEYLSSKNRSVSTINNCLTGLAVMLKKADEDKSINFDFYTSGCNKVKKLKDSRSQEERKSKQIPLTEKQVQKLYELKLEGVNTEARDVFVAQCLLGQRISDMPKLFAGNYKILNEDTVEIDIQKTGRKAVIYLFPMAKKILEKYRVKGFSYLNIETEMNAEDGDDEQKSRSYSNKINERIKIICKNAGFTEMITYIEQRGKKKSTVSKVFYELIHTHTARHTFITLMCKMGIDKETVKLATGHENTKMIDEVYLHESSEDKAHKLGGAIREKATGSLFATSK